MQSSTPRATTVREMAMIYEIKIVTDDYGKLVWECLTAATTRTLSSLQDVPPGGYIGTQFWNQGRTQEIKDRVLHL